MGMKRRVLSIAACLLAVFSIALLAACDTLNDLKTDVTIEVGSPISIDAFFEKVPEGAEFMTDVSGISTSEPGVYQLKIRCGKKSADVILRIEDHTPPTGEAIPQTVYLNWKMPEAKDCIANLSDFSGVALVEYQNGVPSFTEGGEYQVPVVVTDVYGNSAVINVPFTVINDTTPPVISGIRELELEGNPDQLDYLEGVTVTDDYDPEPMLTFDDSKVDYTKTGTYELIYRASDKAGNIGTATTTIKIKVASEVAQALGLTNVVCKQERAEEEKQKFDFVVSRAVMPLPDLVKLVRKNIATKPINAVPNGLIVLKGGDLQDELKPFKEAEATPCSNYFRGEWFVGKQVIYLPL